MTEDTALHFIDAIQWDSNGLLPVITQEQSSGDILMFAWMNRQALEKTIALGEAVYFSRSRQKLWHKGEDSGNKQIVHELNLDCDGDVLLLKVLQQGHTPSIACHTGRHSCFFRRLQRTANGHAWVNHAPVLLDPGLMYGKK